MALNKEPILKKCKALGISPMVMGVAKETKRDPKANVRKKESEYARQLKEKQKLKFIYGVLEKQFRHIYEKAEKMEGQAGANLLTLLELRLDNVAYRMGLSTTRREARQIVDHKHVLVNGKCVNIPSYRISAGDKIEIKEKSKSLQGFKNIVEANAGVVTPAWMESDVETLTGTVKELPLREQIDVPVNDTLIVELYSK